MSASSPATAPPGTLIRSRPQMLRLAQALAYLAAWAIVIPPEIDRWREQPAQFQSLFGWFVRLNIDTTLYVVLLLVAPLFWFWQVGRGSISVQTTRPKVDRNSPVAAETRLQSSDRRGAFRISLMCVIVGAVSLANSVWIGRQLGDLPPAYHDEYSYLIQAKTLLAGKVSYPSPPAEELFDQIHVLNAGKFASRYFPGTGAWLAPFVAAGHPLWGQWAAGALAAVLFCLAGRELAGDWAGFLAGLLIALSPGVVIFSNLLLAHHPTLLGLGLFLLGWLRMLRLRSVFWAVVSGSGLAFAMLCRPPTAAGFALPFGLYLLGWAADAWRRHESPEFRRRLLLGTALAFPLLAAGGALLAYDRAITGNAWLTPYSLYTAIYTPRHVYGFDNVTRGEKELGPRVMQTYDQWAENLTPRLAMRNAFHRLLASAQWTLGVIPLALVFVAGLIFCRGTGMWLLLASILSLHLVHLPYWFVGIMHWHYVFETAPLWCLWCAVVTVRVFAGWRQVHHGAMRWWWCAVLGATGLTSYAAVTGLWDQSRIDAALGEIRHPRQRYAMFSERLARSLPDQPVLVLIEGDPSDRSLDFVLNDPDFKSRILRGRYIPDRVPVAEIRKRYPDRILYHFDVREKRLQRLR